MRYQLVLVENNGDQEVYNVKCNGNIMKNDMRKVFKINVNHAEKRIIFRCSTICASDTYHILGLIRKEISKTYNIKCI